MRTTATDTLKVHAKILPVEYCMQNLCYQATICLAAHPPSHPLYTPVCCAAKRFVKCHHSSLHHLYYVLELDMDSIETIMHSHCPPNASTPYSIFIAESHEQAIADHNTNHNDIKIYCDSSGLDGNAGAAVVLYRAGWLQLQTLRFYLGSLDEHMIYKVEAIGLTLAVHLLSKEDITFPVSIYVDNQVTIKSSDLLY